MTVRRDLRMAIGSSPRGLRKSGSCDRTLSQVQCARTHARIVAVLLALLAGRAAYAQHQDHPDGDAVKENTAFTGLAKAPEANLFLGAATTSISFQLPPGRKNLTPQLALRYTSSGGPGPYGYGWDLPIGLIQRSTAHGMLTCGNLTYAEDFVLVLPSTSVPFTHDPGTGNGTPHVQESFLKIQHQAGSNMWQVWDKSGIKYTFGDTTTTRTGNDVGTIVNYTPCTGSAYLPNYTFSWALTRIEDPNGNRVDIEYENNSGVLYPERVLYGGHANGFAHQFEVDLVWITRPTEDQVAQSLGGFVARVTKYLRRIYVRHPPQGATVRRYEMEYNFDLDADERRIGHQTFLYSVTLRNGSGAPLTRWDTLPASTLFFYQENAPDDDGSGPAVDRFGFGPQHSFPNPHGAGRITLEEDDYREDVRDIFDINGDGFADWIFRGANCGQPATNVYWDVYLGNTAGFAASPVRWEAPFCRIRLTTIEQDPGYATYLKQETRDINGDGIPDFIDATVWTSGDPNWDVYYGYVTATGGGFASVFTGWDAPAGEMRFTLEGDVQGAGYPAAPGSVDWRDLIDMTGDGLPDLVHVPQDTGPWTVWVNFGSQFSPIPRNVPAFINALRWTRLEDEIVGLYDMNNDGLPDQVFAGYGNVAWPGYYRVALNTGATLNTTEQWTVPQAIGGLSIGRRTGDLVTRRILDINGDGLPDLVDTEADPDLYRWGVLLNRGGRFSNTVHPWTTYVGGSIRAAGSQTFEDTFDIDGDGLVDSVSFASPGAVAVYRNKGGAWCASVDGVNCGSGFPGVTLIPNPGGQRPGVLVQMENGVNGTTYLDYRPSTQWDNSGGDGIPDLPFTTWTVTRIEHDDGLCTAAGTGCVSGGAHTVATDIGYLWGRFDWVEREFRGFAIVFPTQDAAGVPREGQVITYSQDAARSGKVGTIARYDATAGSYLTAPLTAAINTWECAHPTSGAPITCPAHPNGNAWVRLQQVEERTYSNFNPNAFKSVTTVNHAWDLCGGQSYGNVAHTSKGDPSGTPRVHTHTDYACVTISSDYIVDKPTHLWVNASGDSPTLEEKWFFYDGSLSLGSVTNGNVTRVESWLDDWVVAPPTCTANGAKRCVNTRTTYDTDGSGAVVFGNILSAYDGEGHLTQTTYDATQIYPARVISPAGHKQDIVYDPGCGVMRSQTIRYTGTTASSERFQWKYDPFCRLTAIANPDENLDTNPNQLFTYELGGQSPTGERRPTLVRVQTKEPAAADGWRYAYTRTDALGRLVQQQETRVVDGSAEVVATATTEYDTGGFAVKQYAPFEASGGAYTSPPGGTGVSTLAYDAIGRVLQVTNPDGSIRTSEHNVAWQTTSKDEC